MADRGLNQKVGNRYHLLEIVGHGGMGIVYRARDQLTGQIIALKRMLIDPDHLTFASQVSTDDSDAARVALATEFRTLAGLRHPHIVGVLDYGFSHDGAVPQPYFTMQYLEHPQTLTDYAQNLPIQGKIQILVDMLLALAYLHRRDIIHRDLKPGNVLVAADGIVKVMDFGLALNQQQSDPEAPLDIAGTLAYMAPELFTGGMPSIKTDLYAAGLIAYETLTGKLPFNTANLVTMVPAIVHQSPDTSMFDAPLARVFDRLLAKQPDDRYSSADEVIESLCAAVDQPLPPENSALRESFLQAAQFVGRAVELKRLTIALDQAIENRGSAWLIGGESGVGKSRLLDELRTRALVAGALVLRGQAVEGGGLPYQLWREPLRLLVLVGDITDVEAGILKEIVPDIATLLERPIADVAVMDGRAGQQRLGQTIISLIRRQNLPLVLLLEDLQWASEGLVLLKQLYAQVGELPLLIVGTYRSDDAPTLPAELPGMEVIPLARLSDTAIADLSASMLGEAGKAPAVVDLLRRETEGNAFFMVEVVRALAEDAGSLQEIGRITLPEQVFAGGVRRVVQRRLNRVPINLHPLLQLAAVIGRQPDAVLMRHLVNNAAELEQFLTVSSHAAVLEPVSGDERWRFSHDKIREFILSQLTKDERKRLRRRVAEALEIVYPGDEAYAGVLVEHWRQAEDAAKETHYALLSAGQMFRTGNLAGARALLERVVKLPGDETEHSSILKTLGDIYERMGDYPQAVETYERGLKLAKTPLENGRLLIGLSWVKWQTGDAAQAKTCAQQALDLCRQVNDERGISRIFGILGILAAESEDFITAQDYFKQGLNLQQQINDQRGVSVSYQNLGQLAMMQGDLTTAQTYLQQSIALQRAMGDLRGLEGSLQNLASLYLGQKQFDQVRPILREALTIAREMAAAPFLLHNVLAAADLYLALGEAEQAATWLALVAAHPACNEEIRQNIKPLQQKLEALPDGEALLAAGREQAANLDLDLAIELIETVL